jgi:hypothetical protein
MLLLFPAQIGCDGAEIIIELLGVRLPDTPYFLNDGVIHG